MNMGDPEYVDVRVCDPCWGSHSLVAATFADAFDRLGLWGTRWTAMHDGGDRVIIEDMSRHRGSPTRRSAVFHVDGVLHVPAALVIALYRRTVVARRKPLMAYEVVGLRGRPVPTSKWTVRGVFGSPRIGCERRANTGMRNDEELSEYGLSPRPSRRLVSGYRFERPDPTDKNWKRFRKTRWKERV